MEPEAYREMAASEGRHWWFAGRRTILSSLIARLSLRGKSRILELGCGTGGNLEMLARFGEVAAMESDDAARAIALEKTAGRFDIRPGRCPDQIPFAGQRFDLVCLFDVLEHIEDDVATLRAVRALLAPAGRALLTVPAYRWLWSAHDEFLHHRRRYTARELRARTLQAGLRIETLSYFNTLLFPLAAAARLLGLDGRRAPAAPLNGVLRALFGAERFVVGRVPLPFGVSLLAVARA
jgi:SAM-dependent methyltransferase